MLTSDNNSDDDKKNDVDPQALKNNEEKIAKDLPRKSKKLKDRKISMKE